MSFFGRSKKKTKEPQYDSIDAWNSGSLGQGIFLGGGGGSLPRTDSVGAGSLSRSLSKGYLGRSLSKSSLEKGSLGTSGNDQPHIFKKILKSGSLRLGGPMNNMDISTFAPSIVVRSRQDPVFRRYLTQLITGPNGTAKAAEEYEETCTHELGFKVKVYNHKLKVFSTISPSKLSPFPPNCNKLSHSFLSE